MKTLKNKTNRYYKKEGDANGKHKNPGTEIN